jgi:deazaflavin-dependent oxidoreductase (nitroreductase family)
MQRISKFLYLTTTGRVSGKPREIEIWFVEHAERFYLIAEHRERLKSVRNVQARPQVNVRVCDAQFGGTARLVQHDVEPELTSAVKALFNAKYGWSDGLLVELKQT